MFLTIGIFVGVLILLSIIESILQEKAKKYWWLRIILSVVPTPHNVMKLFARSQDNLDEFTRVHATSAMSFLGVMGLIIVYAFWADWQVLYGFEYISSRDHSFAWWQATGFAMIIQSMIVFNLGMAIKLKINGKLGDEDHLIQYRMNLVLGLLGLFASVWLSFKTYYSAKAKGVAAKTAIVKDHKANHNDGLSAIDVEVSRYEALYSADTTLVFGVFRDKVTSTEKKYATKIAKKKNKISGLELKQKIASYNAREEKEISDAKNKKNKKLDSLAIVYGPTLHKMQNIRIAAVIKADTTEDNLEVGVDADVDANAALTQGKNILLNLLSIIFNFSLQFYVRGANTELRKKSIKAAKDAKKESQIPVNEKPSNKKEGKSPKSKAKKPKEAPKKEEDEPKLESTIAEINDRNKMPSALGGQGGTLLANMDTLYQVMPNGDINVAYRGVNRDDFGNWSYWRSKLGNRISKYKMVKSETSKDNHLEWIRMIEDKMTFIEELQQSTNPRKLPKRNSFNPKKDNQELFSK